MKYIPPVLAVSFFAIFLASLSAGRPLHEALLWGVVMVLAGPLFVAALFGAITVASGFRWERRGEKEERSK